MKGDSVLITGSSGTIGTALTQRLRSEGYEVRCTDVVANPWIPEDQTITADLRNPDEVADLPGDVDTIVHLGAHARVHRLVREPTYALHNLEMTFNVLEHARRSDVSNFLFASSREVYGDTDQVVHAEEDAAVDNSESPYTASKVGGEAMVRAFGKCYGMSTCTTRFSNVYGRYDKSDRVVPQFIARCSRGQPLCVYGSEKVLDFTYLDDCVDGVVKILERFPKAKGTTFNISSGQGASLIELARKINDRTPHCSEIRVEPSRTGEVNRYVGDITKARTILDYRPQYSLTDGLERTIDWYLDRPSILDHVLSRASDE